MKYVVRLKSGEVVPVATIPIAVIGGPVGYRKVVGTKRVAGRCLLLFADGALDVGADDFDIGDLAPESRPGLLFVFPDIHADVIGKWGPGQREAVESVRPMVSGEVPTDRTFRAAWRDAGEKIEVDMPAAREIVRGRLRDARKPLLADLDVQYQRADEAGDTTAKRTVAAAKQALRDVTADPRIDAAGTPEELKALLGTLGV